MCVTDSDCYRPGDVQRLHNKIQQLEARLPMQSTMVQVPYENTLGGFAMFNTGVTDLAPELTGWYGAPAVNPGADTTVFLVGNHFSVLQTKVLAGGLAVTGQEMLSRQVLKVTIPAKAMQVGDAAQKFVDVNLATPYGVTQHLLIPVATPAGGATADGAIPGPSWKPAEITLAFVYGGLGITAPPPAAGPAFKPASLLIAPGNDIKPEVYDTVEVTLDFDKKVAPGGAVTLGAITYDGKKGYPVKGDVLAGAILPAVATTFGPEAFPPSSFTVPTKLKFKSSKLLGPDIEVNSGNDLSVKWIEATTD